MPGLSAFGDIFSHISDRLDHTVDREHRCAVADQKSKNQKQQSDPIRPCGLPLKCCGCIRVDSVVCTEQHFFRLFGQLFVHDVHNCPADGRHGGADHVVFCSVDGYGLQSRGFVQCGADKCGKRFVFRSTEILRFALERDLKDAARLGTEDHLPAIVDQIGVCALFRGFDEVIHAVEHDVDADDTDYFAIQFDGGGAGNEKLSGKRVDRDPGKIQIVRFRCAEIPRTFPDRERNRLTGFRELVLSFVVDAKIGAVDQPDIASVDLLGVLMHRDHRRL